MSNQSRLKFIFFLIVTSTIGQMAAEIYIPSLPYISHDFHTTAQTSEFSVAVFLFGMGILGIFFGYLSDFLGRRKILIIATIISFLGTLLCALAPNIWILILGRFIQGLGFSGVGSLSRAILRDKMSGVELAKFASRLSMVLALVIDLSPFVGSFFQEWWGWRSIFVMLLIYNLLAIYMSFKYKEEGNINYEIKFSFKIIIRNTSNILKNRDFLRYNLLASCTYAIMMSYLTVASFLFEKELGLTPIEFGATTFGLTFIYMFGSYLNSKLLKKKTMDNLIAKGVTIMWVSVLVLVALATILPLSYLGLIAFVAVMYIGCGLLFANSSASAFTLINSGIGGASAVYGTMQVLIGAIFATVISCYHSTTTLPLAIIVTIMSAILKFGKKGKKECIN
ncbi:MAG: multidrug effflux MFS transporter [Fusobacteria bacterium]|nr:multidrug effflux MFS transporter [Fusobacteriota bacterium]